MFLQALIFSFTLLWFLFFLRLVFFTWEATERPVAVRRQGWQFWRVAQIVCAAAIFMVAVSLQSIAANIVQLGAAALFTASAVLHLHGLDIAVTDNRYGWVSYLAIVVVSILYVVGFA